MDDTSQFPGPLANATREQLLRILQAQHMPGNLASSDDSLGHTAASGAARRGGAPSLPIHGPSGATAAPWGPAPTARDLNSRSIQEQQVMHVLLQSLHARDAAAAAATAAATAAAAPPAASVPPALALNGPLLSQLRAAPRPGLLQHLQQQQLQQQVLQQQIQLQHQQQLLTALCGALGVSLPVPFTAAAAPATPPAPLPATPISSFSGTTSTLLHALLGEGGVASLAHSLHSGLLPAVDDGASPTSENATAAHTGVLTPLLASLAGHAAGGGGAAPLLPAGASLGSGGGDAGAGTHGAALSDMTHLPPALDSPSRSVHAGAVPLAPDAVGGGMDRLHQLLDASCLAQAAAEAEAAVGAATLAPRAASRGALSHSGSESTMSAPRDGEGDPRSHGGGPSAVAMRRPRTGGVGRRRLDDDDDAGYYPGAGASGPGGGGDAPMDDDDDAGSDDDDDFERGGHRSAAAAAAAARTKKSVHQRVTSFPEQTRETCRQRWADGTGVDVVCNDLNGRMRQSYGRCVVQFGRDASMQVGSTSDFLRAAGEQRTKRWRRLMRTPEFKRPGRFGVPMTVEEFLAIVGF